MKYNIDIKAIVPECRHYNVIVDSTSILDAERLATDRVKEILISEKYNVADIKISTYRVERLESPKIPTIRQLVLSRIQTPDGTILTSKHRHDFQQHKDANGETYFLDGGLDYQRVSVNKEPYKNLSLYIDSPFEEIRVAFDVTYKDKTYTLENLSDEALSTILDNSNINKWDDITYNLCLKEAEYRTTH